MTVKDMRRALHFFEGCVRIIRRMEAAALADDTPRLVTAQLELADHADAHSELVAPPPTKGAEA